MARAFVILCILLVAVCLFAPTTVAEGSDPTTSTTSTGSTTGSTSGTLIDPGSSCRPNCA